MRELELLASRQQQLADSTTGHWQVVRMCVDQPTQEWLNVGIFFRASDGQTHWQLLENFNGMRCLYDEDAADNARFLLEQAEYAFETGQALPDGWHLTLGPTKFVRGLSTADEVVASLFNRMVPLGQHQKGTAGRIDREDHPHATLNVRSTVRRLINQHLQLAHSATPDFWHRAPLHLQRNNAALRIDVQIASRVGNLPIHGAVASAWYKTHYHRKASLSSATAATMAACQAFPDGQNLLYLLQPPKHTPGISLQNHKDIAEEIGTCKWLLEQHGAKVRVTAEERAMAHDILRDLRMLPEPF